VISAVAIILQQKCPDTKEYGVNHEYDNNMFWKAFHSFTHKSEQHVTWN